MKRELSHSHSFIEYLIFFYCFCSYFISLAYLRSVFTAMTPNDILYSIHITHLLISIPKCNKANIIIFDCHKIYIISLSHIFIDNNYGPSSDIAFVCLCVVYFVSLLATYAHLLNVYGECNQIMLNYFNEQWDISND